MPPSFTAIPSSNTSSPGTSPASINFFNVMRPCVSSGMHSTGRLWSIVFYFYSESLSDHYFPLASTAASIGPIHCGWPLYIMVACIVSAWVLVGHGVLIAWILVSSIRCVVLGSAGSILVGSWLLDAAHYFRGAILMALRSQPQSYSISLDSYFSSSRDSIHRYGFFGLKYAVQACSRYS